MPTRAPKETREAKEARLSSEHGKPVRLLVYLGLEMPVFEPSKEQMAVMARMTTMERSMAGLKDDAFTKAAVRNVARVGNVLASFFADADDWDTIELAMANGRVAYDEIPELYSLVFKLWNDEEAVVPNRAEKRTRARRTTAS